MTLVGLSATMLYTAFGLYSIATILFGFGIKTKDNKGEKNKTGTIAILVTIIGLVAQLIYFIILCIAVGQASLGNYLVFITFFGLNLFIGFFIISFLFYF